MIPGLAQFFQPHPLGVVYENSDITVFFGNRESTRENVESAFPDYAMNILKQTHSDQIVLTPSAPVFGELAVEADAHVTRSRGQALCIRTADCMPVMIHDPTTGWAAGIHAGWRGIENEIIRKTCARLKVEGASLSSARAWIGPHIGSASFEVGLDVAARLESRFDAVRGYSTDATSLVNEKAPVEGKARIDLLTIARAQLAASGIERERVLVLPVDTYISLDHESFRRDRDRAGRQISFIALK